MKKFTSLTTAQRAANSMDGVIAVKVIDGDNHYWAIRKDPETSAIYL